MSITAPSVAPLLQVTMKWIRRLFRKLFPAANHSSEETEAYPGHPSLVGGFNPLTFIWHYDHVERCAPDEECWIKVSERLVTDAGEMGPQPLLGDTYAPEEKSVRLWEQVLWAHEHGILEQFSDWIYGCDLMDFERKKWQSGCAFYEVALGLYKLAEKKK